MRLGLSLSLISGEELEWGSGGGGGVYGYEGWVWDRLEGGR